MLPDARPVYSLEGALRAQLDQALRASSRADDHSVHDVRKQLKRARATLRLMRASIGDTRYHSANQRLRDAAHRLRPPRDAAALLKTLEKVARPGDGKGMKALTEQWRRRLRQARGSARGRLSHRGRRLDAEQMRRVCQQVVDRPIRKPDAFSACRGIKKSYKDGHRAFAVARLDPSDLLLHECRKQAKYLANELQLARRLLPLGFRKTHRRAVKLALALGDDHDLAALSDKLSASVNAATAPSAARRLEKMKHRIERKRRKLQAKVWRRGKKLYRRSATELGARLKDELR